MRATKENAVFFVADEDLDIYPEGLGLEPISLKTHQETREEVEAAIAGLKALVEEPVAEPVIPEEPQLEIVPEESQLEVLQEEPQPEQETVAVEEVIEVVEPAVQDALPVPEPVADVPSKNYMKILLWVLVAVVALLVVFVVVARLNPGLMDSLLYTPEQLEILNR